MGVITPPLNASVMRLKPPTLKGTGLLFAFCAFAQIFVAAITLYVLRPSPGTSLPSAAYDVLFAILSPALVAGVCALVMLAFPRSSRRTHFSLLIICVAACAGILLSGWGLLVVPVAVPAALLALHLRYTDA
jgi:hypothetical protein